MENATKALLIAAGILMGLAIISMIIVGYRQISNYYTTKEKSKIVEQLSEFNNQYIPYNREDVRGSDLLSLINKVIDFNKLSDEEEITISIYIPMNDKAKLLYYNYNDNKNIKLIPLGTNGITYKITATENTIKSMLNDANNIENTYDQYGKGMANQLANNLSVLFSYDESKIRNRTSYLEELKVPDTGNRLTNDILKYYQYVQFKRAHFNCESLTFTENGRVKSFKFTFNNKFE